MISRYRILARVDLFHDYYLAGKTGDFDVVPSEATAARMAETRLRAKTVGNAFLVLIPVDADGKPAVLLPPDIRLVFHLDLKDPAFLTVTNVDADALRTRRFHFSNLTGNSAGAGPGTTLNLTRPIAPYDNAKAYAPGDFAAIGTAVYECVKAAGGQAPDAPGSLFWVAKGTAQAASALDLVPFRGSVANLSVQTPARVFRVRAFGLDPATNAYTRLAREEVLVPSPAEDTRNLQVDLGDLPPGRYRLDVNGEVFEAWFDDEALFRGSFGVIEIFNHLPKDHAFSLVDPSDKVREAAYAIRFANRRAYWKYVTPLHKVDAILPSADHALPSPFTAGSDDPAQPAQKDWFLSNRPLPLTEVPDGNLFDLVMGSEARPAPKPDPRVPGMLTQVYDAPTQRYLDSICTIRLNH